MSKQDILNFWIEAKRLNSNMDQKLFNEKIKEYMQDLKREGDNNDKTK